MAPACSSGLASPGPSAIPVFSAPSPSHSADDFIQTRYGRGRYSKAALRWPQTEPASKGGSRLRWGKPSRSHSDCETRPHPAPDRCTSLSPSRRGNLWPRWIAWASPPRNAGTPSGRTGYSASPAGTVSAPCTKLHIHASRHRRENSGDRPFLIQRNWITARTQHNPPPNPL
jgi:hypothetical protein